MPESEINRENVRSNFRDAQHLATHHRFGAYDFQLPSSKGAGRRVSNDRVSFPIRTVQIKFG
jgi:hypothetical protein